MRVYVLNNTQANEPKMPDIWALCFQWCRYIYEDGETEHGYRFIWKRPDGSLQAARGQARIPSLKIMNQLVDTARIEGWANNDADEIDG